MLVPLQELIRYARLEWNPTERCIRLLKWAEALAAAAAANLITNYVHSSKIEPRLERELRATATPAFGTYVSILRIGVELKRSFSDTDFFSFLEKKYPSDQYSSLLEAIAALRTRFALGEGPKREANSVDVLDVLLGVRNRGIGHGGIPSSEEAKLIEVVCEALISSCNELATPQAVTVSDISADSERVGEFLVRGILFAGDSEKLWQERRAYEDLLSLKRLHFLDSKGRAVPSPPFLQLEGRSFWFLQKYRRGGKSLFSDFKSAQSRSDSHWDEYLKDFYEGRFEQGDRIPVQVSPTGVFHNLPPENEAYRKFIGRLKDLRDLHSNLRPERRTHIVALGGVGGVGKTAVARALAQSVADSPDQGRNFDYIVWVSAKTNVLKETVEALRPGFEDVEDVLDEIARVADSPQLIYQKPFEKKKAEILDLLAGGRFLLVIDNFETVKRKEKILGVLTRHSVSFEGFGYKP